MLKSCHQNWIQPKLDTIGCYFFFFCFVFRFTWLHVIQVSQLGGPGKSWFGWACYNSHRKAHNSPQTVWCINSSIIFFGCSWCINSTKLVKREWKTIRKTRFERPLKSKFLTQEWVACCNVNYKHVKTVWNSWLTWKSINIF